MKILDIPCNAFDVEGDTKPEFYNSEGWLSDYALDCGYIEQIDFWGDDPNVYLTVSMFKDGCYHVRYWNEIENDRIWKHFDTIESARLDFKYYALKLISEVQEWHVDYGVYNKLANYI